MHADDLDVCPPNQAGPVPQLVDDSEFLLYQREIHSECRRVQTGRLVCGWVNQPGIIVLYLVTMCDWYKIHPAFRWTHWHQSNDHTYLSRGGNILNLCSMMLNDAQ